jgi:hypothetical protein
MNGLWAVAAWGPGPRVHRSKAGRAKGFIEQELSAESYGLASSSSFLSASLIPLMFFPLISSKFV